MSALDAEAEMAIDEPESTTPGAGRTGKAFCHLAGDGIAVKDAAV